MPPQVNATVTAVHDRSAATPAGGAVDDWDTPGADSADETAAGAGAQKWAGAVNAYYREKVDRVPDGAGGVNLLTRRTLWIDTADLDLIELDNDDLLTFTVGGVASSGAARTIAASRLAGIPRELATTRIDLDDK